MVCGSQVIDVTAKTCEKDMGHKGLVTHTV